MIRASEIVLSIRSKTGDTDAKNYRFSDMEIIDSINDAMDELAEELLWSTRTWLIDSKDGVGRYELPADFLRPIHASINGKIIEEIESLEHRSQSENFSSGMAYDNRSLHIFPASSVKSSDTIELYYNNYERINDKSDTLAFANGAKLVIVYYVMHLLYQNPISKNHLQKSSEYLGLYTRRLQGIKSQQRSNVQSKNKRTRFNRV